MSECARMTGGTPLERQVWLYRELYGLPCLASGTRITLSTSDVSAISAPSGVAALIDDELFWSKQVTPILTDGCDRLIILAAPNPLDTCGRTVPVLRRTNCEFLPSERQILLPQPFTPGPRWFRYPQHETLQPLAAVLRALRTVLHLRPRTYPA